MRYNHKYINPYIPDFDLTVNIFTICHTDTNHITQAMANPEIIVRKLFALYPISIFQKYLQHLPHSSKQIIYQPIGMLW